MGWVRWVSGGMGDVGVRWGGCQVGVRWVG